MLHSANTQLVSAFLELMAYGCYLVVFLWCMKVLHAKYTRGKQLSIYLLLTTLSIFLLATVHTVLTGVRTYEAYTAHMEQPYAAEAYFADFGARSSVMSEATYATTTLVADLFLVYRTWVLYGHNWHVVVLPLLLFGLNIGLSTWSLWSLSQLKLPFNQQAFETVVSHSNSFFISTLVLNLLCTFLISYRIWVVLSTSVHAVGGKGWLRNVFTVVIDSAAIYSAFMVALIIVNSRILPVTQIFLNPMSSIIGMVFSSIIIRLWLSDEEESSPITKRTPELMTSRRQRSSTELALQPRQPTQFNQFSNEMQGDMSTTRAEV